ncbi:hypothetical protein CF319_g3664 [Tilletia indica]|nr:hypothetical protein CF319_g3664 [Tilletia indica]
MVAAIAISAASSSASAIASHLLIATTPRCASRCVLSANVRQRYASSSATSTNSRYPSASSASSRANVPEPPSSPNVARWASTSAAAAPATTTSSSSSAASSSSPSLAPHLTSAPDPSGRFDMPRMNMDMEQPPVPPHPQAAPLSESKSGKAAPQRASRFRAQKAPISLTPSAVVRLRALLESPTDPKLIRISVKNKGCAGMSYHLEYVKPEEAGKFDERVKQDDVTVLIDSKALFSIIGSEMDWKEDRLSAKFVFNNPLAVSCGCGESFNVK